MEFLRQILSLTWLVTLIAFIVYWRKKVGAKKSAGENYKDDENYKNISRTKRIIGLVCIASFVLVGVIPQDNHQSNSSSNYQSQQREIEQAESVKKMNDEYQKKYNKTEEDREAERQAKAQEESQKYAEANIDVLLDEVKSNAAKANKNYKGKYVKIVGGVVKNIESNARYFNLEGSDPYAFLINVQCYPKNNSVKNAMLELSVGQYVTVYGKITDVGEIMGYSLDAEKIE